MKNTQKEEACVLDHSPWRDTKQYEARKRKGWHTVGSFGSWKKSKMDSEPSVVGEIGKEKRPTTRSLSARETEHNSCYN